MIIWQEEEEVSVPQHGDTRKQQLSRLVVDESGDLWGVYEQLARAREMTVTPEAASQINDTLTGGLIANWGDRLVGRRGAMGFSELMEGFSENSRPLPRESSAEAFGLRGAVFSPFGGLGVEQIFYSAALRCNGLTV